MTTPFTNSTPENFSCDEFHCERGWLPADGAADAEVDVCDSAVVVVTPLLIPTHWRRCFCSESDLLPEGVVV